MDMIENKSVEESCNSSVEKLLLSQSGCVKIVHW